MGQPHLINGRLQSRADDVEPKLKSLASFLDAWEPLDFVIDRIVQAGCVYTLTAPTGVGKTAWVILAALAVASGRADILGIPVTQGRVVFMAFENASGTQMRLLSACKALGIDYRAISDNFIIIDEWMSPEHAVAKIQQVSRHKPLRLCVVDTLAAAFDGTDAMDPVSTGRFIRRCRPLTALVGRPPVVIPAHPVKGATRQNLIPYGSGAVINEVDANLTLWMDARGSVELHYQTKLRGAPFDPISYRFVDTTSEVVVDSKGRAIPLTTLRPQLETSCNPTDSIGHQPASNLLDRLLLVMAEHPKGTQEDWAKACGAVKSSVNHRLKTNARYVSKVGARWVLNADGMARANDLKRSK